MLPRWLGDAGGEDVDAAQDLAGLWRADCPHGIEARAGAVASHLFGFANQLLAQCSEDAHDPSTASATPPAFNPPPA